MASVKWDLMYGERRSIEFKRGSDQHFDMYMGQQRIASLVLAWLASGFVLSLLSTGYSKQKPNDPLYAELWFLHADSRLVPAQGTLVCELMAEASSRIKTALAHITVTVTAIEASGDVVLDLVVHPQKV